MNRRWLCKVFVREVVRWDCAQRLCARLCAEVVHKTLDMSSMHNLKRLCRSSGTTCLDLRFSTSAVAQPFKVVKFFFR